MRECPKCGHIDPECWRPAAFHQHIDYADIDSLELFEPEVFQLMKDKIPGEIAKLYPFVYWKSPKSHTIRRSSIEDFKIKGKSVPQERVSHNPQLTLEMRKVKDDSINLLYVNHPKIADNMTKPDTEGGA